MKRYLTIFITIFISGCFHAHANSIENTPEAVWKHVDAHKLAVIGKLEEKKIVAVFSGSKPVQIGGLVVKQDKSLPKFGTALMSGKITVESIIFPIEGKKMTFTELWVTWTEDVALHPGWTSVSMCPTLSKETLKGAKTIFLLNHGKASVEVGHELSLKYLANYNKKKKALLDKAEAETKAMFDEIWGPSDE